MGGGSQVPQNQSEARGLLLQPGRSPISLTSLSCLAGKLLSAWATNPVRSQGPTSVSLLLEVRGFLNLPSGIWAVQVGT